MWQYRVTTLDSCLTSTYQPQPVVFDEPSTSHDGPDVLHRTVTTTPLAAERIGVQRACGRSTPSCVGRDGVRKPLTMATFGTGSTQRPVSLTLIAGAAIGGSAPGVGVEPQAE